MEGTTLKDIIRDSGVNLDELSAKSGIPKRSFFNLYKKEKVEKHYLDKLKKAGLKIPNSTTNSNIVAEPVEPYKTKNNVDKIIDALTKAVDTLSSDNQHFRSEIKEANQIIRDYIITTNDRRLPKTG